MGSLKLRTGAVAVGRRLRAGILPAVFGLLVSSASFAQSIAEEGAQALTLATVPDIEQGKAAILQGEAGPDGDKFFVANLFVTQPVSVVLMAANPAQPLTLDLSKYLYEDFDRSGSTGSSGAVSFDFRTQGELKILVKPERAGADETAGYFLVVWAGDDVQPDLAPPVVLQAEGERGGGLPSLWLLGLVFVAGGAVVIAINRRRKA
ncbi:MAG: hypothetical protein ACC682_11430 [Gemmatimonadota bacterium]